LRLSRYFGTTPQLWLNLQNQYDLYRIAHKKESELEQIRAVSLDVLAS
jgi:plasmid maintenance system antidote protein VapI